MRKLNINIPAYRFWFAAMALAVAALAVLYVLDKPQWPLLCVMAVLLLLMIAAARSVHRPLHAMQSGLYLIREQDYSSRLRRVGQADADRVVELFNSLMDSMKHERLRLEEQNRFLDILIEASPSGIAICNFDGTVSSANSAFRAMATPPVMEVLGRLADGRSEVCRPGESQILRCSRRSFMDSGFHRPFFMIDLLTDEIVQAEKAVFNKMVRTISHEINNSLGSVISVLESLEELHADDPVVTSAISAAHNSCLNLSLFTRGYAEVAKLPKPEPEPIELKVFVERLLPSLAKLCTNDIELRAESADSPTVSADPVLMERVLVNLVKNSAESIGSRGGTITIRSATGTLIVEDNGPGLSAEATGRIFTPFFSTKHSDRGLGLMLVSDILHSQHLRFSLITDPDDGLTRFTIKWQ